MTCEKTISDNIAEEKGGNLKNPVPEPDQGVDKSEAEGNLPEPDQAVDKSEEDLNLPEPVAEPDQAFDESEAEGKSPKVRLEDVKKVTVSNKVINDVLRP